MDKKNSNAVANKERFLELCTAIKRVGIDDLLKWLEDTDFYYAPASSKFHCNYPGGLVEHSLNVYNEMCRLLKAYPEVSVSEETLAIVTLFHDLCKVDCYVQELRNRKNEFGKWESYVAYKKQEKFKHGGHGSKSVYLIQKFINLTDDEAVAINCHMGPHEIENVGVVFEQCPLAFLLSTADSSATFLIEGGAN